MSVWVKITPLAVYMRTKSKQKLRINTSLLVLSGGFK